MRRLHLLALLVLVASLLLASWPREAAANNQDIFGMGPRGQGLAGTQTASVRDGTAAYSNPAALSEMDPSRLTVGASFTDIDVEMEVEDPARRDAERSAEDVDDFPGGTLAWGHAVPTGWGGEAAEEVRRFGYGLALFTSPRLVAIRAESEEEPRWTQYEGRAERLGLYAGASLELMPGLSVGGGAIVLADFTADIAIDASTSSEPSEMTFEADLVLDGAPTAGLLVRPHDDWAFGLAYRGEISLKVDVDTQTAFSGVGVGTVRTEAFALFSPRQVSLGTSWRPTDGLEVAVDATWYDWSKYEGPAPRIDGGGTGITGNIPEDPGYSDIVSPSLGVEGRVRDDLALRGGYRYRPGPAPEPDGEANLIDPDKHVFAVGTGWRLPVDGLDADLEAAFQVHWSPTLEVEKTDPPGDFETRALVLHGTIGLTVRF